MIYHIVMWRWKPEIGEEEKAQRLADMQTHLTGLVGKVPGLLTAKVVTAPFPSSTHDVALITTMERAEDINVYAAHPEHVKAADTYVRPFVCDRVCLNCDMA